MTPYVHDLIRRRDLLWLAAVIDGGLTGACALYIEEFPHWLALALVFLAMTGIWLVFAVHSLDGSIEEFMRAIHPDRKSD